MFVPMLLIPLFVLFGFTWILFAFVNPPYFLTHIYFSPRILYFMGERTGRILVGVVLGVVVPLLISMFWL